MVWFHHAKRYHLVHLVEAVMEAIGGVDVLHFTGFASVPALGAGSRRHRTLRGRECQDGDINAKSIPC
jgi:hypothetical protein